LRCERRGCERRGGEEHEGDGRGCEGCDGVTHKTILGPLGSSCKGGVRSRAAVADAWPQIGAAASRPCSDAAAAARLLWDRCFISIHVDIDARADPAHRSRSSERVQLWEELELVGSFLWLTIHYDFGDPLAVRWSRTRRRSTSRSRSGQRKRRRIGVGRRPKRSRPNCPANSGARGHTP
jgi:hypothetical protein